MPSRVLAALHTRRGAGIALTALVLAHTALNVAWLRYDEHVIRIDEEFHASAAQDYYFALTDPSISGLAARISAIVALESPYPPFAHVVGAIPPLFLGYCSDTVSFSATLCFVALILGIYLVARRIYSRPAALFAAAVTSLIPVLFAGSRYVALENVITALTVWGLYFLMASDGFRARRYIVAFGLVNGCAILTKPNAFVYYLLPAAAVFTHGLWLAWRARKPGGAMAVAMNGIICIGLTCAVALPWYLYHRTALEQYWMSEHKGGKTPFTFTRGEASETGGKILEDRIYNPALHRSGQKKEALPPPTPAAATAAAAATAQAPAQPQTAEVQTAGPPTAKAAPGAWTIDLQGILTSREWGAYPLLVVNNGAFLPLTLLGLAGLLVSLWRRRGNGALWLIIAWFVGSYVLNTLLFRFINPRYAMPFIGVLGIGAAGLLDVLPGRKSRAAFVSVTLLLLAAQYANMSFLNFERVNTWLPVLKDSFRVKYFHDEGLTITKAQIITGTYCFRAPLPGEDYVSRGFRVMSENERRNGSTPGGHVPYISMARQNNFGGFRNMESTFWPEPNPLLRRDLRGKPDMQYAFERIARCVSVEEAGPALQEARYVVATLDINDATLEEGPYHGYFKALRDAAPLEMIDFFMTPAYGLLPAGMVAVFYRGAPDPIAGIADLRGKEAASDPAALAFNAMDLLSVLQRDAVAPVLNDTQRADCNARASAILPLLQNQMAISPNIDLTRIAIDQPYSGWYRLRMLFHVKAQPSNNWRMYVSGSFGAEVAHLVPEKVRTQKYFSWNFDPDRPTSTWRPGDYVLCTKEFACPPILLKNISIGFVKNNEMQGQMINTGEIDFAAIPVNERPPLAHAATTK